MHQVVSCSSSKMASPTCGSGCVVVKWRILTAQQLFAKTTGTDTLLIDYPCCARLWCPRIMPLVFFPGRGHVIRAGRVSENYVMVKTTQSASGVESLCDLFLHAPPGNRGGFSLGRTTRLKSCICQCRCAANKNL